MDLTSSSRFARPVRATLTCALTAALLAGCDRPKVEESHEEKVATPRKETARAFPAMAPDAFQPADTGPSPGPLPGQLQPAGPVSKWSGSAPQSPPVLHLDPTPPAWERKLAEQSAPDVAPADRAQAIIAMLPTLPPEGLGPAARLMVSGLPDVLYSKTVLPVILNPKTSGQVLSPLFADLVDNRSDAVTLPTLVSIASTTDHPYAPYALDDLRLLMSADYGSDWDQWLQAVRQKLAPTQPGQPTQ